jgi:hypothetical protein
MGDQELKQYCLMGGARLLNKAFRQALKLQAMKAAAKPPIRLQEVRMDCSPYGNASR